MRREGGLWSLLDFEIWQYPIKFLAKKGCFLSFKWLELNFVAVGPPCKNVFLANPEKFATGLSLEKILPTPMFRKIHVYSCKHVYHAR